MDTKDSKANCHVLEKYRDIFSLSRPTPSYRHPRMPIPDRAKIFSPFSALRGYDEEIAQENKKRLRVSRRLLCEEDTDRISHLLLHVRKNMTITVHFFKEDALPPSSPPLGIYLEITGIVTEIDFPCRQLFLFDGTKSFCISFNDIDALSI